MSLAVAAHLGSVQKNDLHLGISPIFGIGYPAAIAHFIAGLEFTGGILLVLGLASRLIAVPLTINMLVAYITVDRQALLSFFSDPDKFYAAAPYTVLFASLTVLLFGPGIFAIDEWIGKRFARADRLTPLTTDPSGDERASRT